MPDMRWYRMTGRFFRLSSSAIRPSTCRSNEPVSALRSHAEGTSAYRRSRLKLQRRLALVTHWDGASEDSGVGSRFSEKCDGVNGA